jgi:hypothetical protein
MDGERAQVEANPRVAGDRRPARTFRSHTSFIDAVRKRVEALRPTERPDDPDEPYRPRRTRSIASSLHSWVRMIR